MCRQILSEKNARVMECPDGPNSNTSESTRKKTVYFSPTTEADEHNNRLTSSLPSSDFRKEMSTSVEKARKAAEKFRNRLSMEVDPAGPDDDGDNFGGAIQRPRSASLHGNHNNIRPPQGKKRMLRTLSRSRPASARFGTGTGRGRSDSVSQEKETKAGIQNVENQFTKIRAQLAQLSKEDAVLQERLDRLSKEIDSIQRYASRLCHSQLNPMTEPETVGVLKVDASSMSPPHNDAKQMTIPKLIISTSQQDLVHLTINNESWKEDKLKGGEDDDEELNLLGDYSNDCGKSSLGSCGSLADSEGSLSPNRAPCCIVVVDHDKNLRPTSASSFNFPCEDDVFLS